jgi:Leucine-rich repeat (LRR) protein
VTPDGEQQFHDYYPAPGKSFWETMQTGGWRSADRPGTGVTELDTYIYTKAHDPTDLEGYSLVKVRLGTGLEEGRIWLDERNPDYLMNPGTGMIYFKRDKKEFDALSFVDRTALGYAARNGYGAMVALLLDRGAEVNAASENGWTALSWAALRGHTEIVRELLDRGAHVNPVADEAWTPWMLAAREGHADAVEVPRRRRQATRHASWGRTPGIPCAGTAPSGTMRQRSLRPVIWPWLASPRTATSGRAAQWRGPSPETSKGLSKTSRLSSNGRKATFSGATANAGSELFGWARIRSRKNCSSRSGASDEVGPADAHPDDETSRPVRREDSGMYRRVLSLIIGLLLPLGCGGDPTGSAVRLGPGELCSDHPDAAIATFEDANLEAAIRAALSVGAQESLTCGLISGLTEFGAPLAGITSLVGIQNLTSLTQLRLFENSITNISALRGLTSLTDLSLGGNSITDISALRGLTSLTELSLGGNSITDISALSGLTSLTVLTLAGNSITDINVLSGLTSLTDLSLGGNSITDISALSGLTSLTILDLGYNSITDISALSGLTNLTELWLFNNPNLTDIQPLLGNAGLGAGDSVSLQSTSVSCTDVDALQLKGVNVTSDC